MLELEQQIRELKAFSGLSGCVAAVFVLIVSVVIWILLANIKVTVCGQGVVLPVRYMRDVELQIKNYTIQYKEIFVNSRKLYLQKKKMFSRHELTDAQYQVAINDMNAAAKNVENAKNGKFIYDITKKSAGEEHDLQEVVGIVNANQAGKLKAGMHVIIKQDDINHYNEQINGVVIKISKAPVSKAYLTAIFGEVGMFEGMIARSSPYLVEFALDNPDEFTHRSIVEFAIICQYHHPYQLI